MESTAETTDPNSDSDSDEMHDIMFAKRGCCHWHIPIFSCIGKSNTSGSSWERISSSSPEKELEAKSGWWLSAFMKLREWSEVVAGPRWKTFIRRFNKNSRGCCGMRNGKFQYDALSYALNFDDGVGGQNVHFDNVFRDFSSRYAAIPISTKSSINLREGD